MGISWAVIGWMSLSRVTLMMVIRVAFHIWHASGGQIACFFDRTSFPIMTLMSVSKQFGSAFWTCDVQLGSVVPTVSNRKSLVVLLFSDFWRDVPAFLQTTGGERLTGGNPAVNFQVLLRVWSPPR